jgi:hypothetical protein
MPIPKQRGLVLVIAVWSLMAAGAARAELITNGGFELPVVVNPSGVQTVTSPDSATIIGWSVTGGSVDLTRGGIFFTFPYQGFQTLDLDGTVPGQIEQTIPTVPGTTYTLSFAYANNPDGASASANVLVTGVGGTVFSQAITHSGSMNGGLTQMNYTVLNTTFVANSASETIRFTSTDPANDSLGIVLDAVSVNPLGPTVPEPSALVLAGTGLIGLLGYGARRRFSRVVA